MISPPVLLLTLTRTATGRLPRSVFWTAMKGTNSGKLDLGFSRAPVWRRQRPRSLFPFSTKPSEAKKWLADLKDGNPTRTEALSESSSNQQRADFQKRQKELAQSRVGKPQRSSPTSFPKSENPTSRNRRASVLEKGSFQQPKSNSGGFQKKGGVDSRGSREAEETTSAAPPWDAFTEEDGKKSEKEEKSEKGEKSEKAEEIPVPALPQVESLLTQSFLEKGGRTASSAPSISNPTPPSIPTPQVLQQHPTAPPPKPTQPFPPPQEIESERSTSLGKSFKPMVGGGKGRKSAGEEDGELDDGAVAERKAALLEALGEKGVEIGAIDKGTRRMICPECEGGSSGEASFSVTVSADYTSAVYNCFRAKCGFQGGVHFQSSFKKAEKKFSGFGHSEEMASYTVPEPSLLPLDEVCKRFFRERGISEATLTENRIAMEMRNGVPHIAFPYFRNGKLVNVKYRTLDKKFSQIKGAEKILYGLDDIQGKEEFIIVEGEMDKLALNEIGLWNVASIPDGAPSPSSVKKRIPNPDEDKKFSFLWNCREVFEDAKKIIFAADNDEPGEALQAELTRRIGTFRCWVVDFPICYEDSIKPKECSEEEMLDDDVWFRKDANEVLMKDGAEVLHQYILNCRPYPIVGLSRFIDHSEDLVAYYNSELDKHTGLSTGWPSLDAFYKVVPGELSIVTGVPNSGKSEFLDALAVNLAQSTDCAIAFCSMEKHVHEHGRQLVEKFIGKPFFSGLNYTQGQRRLDEEELKKAILWIDAHFPLILSKKDELPNMDWVLDMARMSIFRYGIKGLVIDPYNELDHQRPTHMSETEYVSQMLAKVKRFAQTYGVHVWFVAHPRQMHNWAGEPPNLYDISGSAHFVNKADAGIVVHRNWKHGDEKKEKTGKRWDDDDDDGDDDDSNAGIYSKEDPQLLVRILIRKMRNKTAGTVGECTLKYDPVTGRYLDLAAVIQS